MKLFSEYPRQDLYADEFIAEEKRRNAFIAELPGQYPDTTQTLPFRYTNSEFKKWVLYLYKKDDSRLNEEEEQVRSFEIYLDQMRKNVSFSDNGEFFQRVSVMMRQGWLLEILSALLRAKNKCYSANDLPLD